MRKRNLNNYQRVKPVYKDGSVWESTDLAPITAKDCCGFEAGRVIRLNKEKEVDLEI